DDAGPGVPAEDRERIFEPFYRRDGDGRLPLPGHGLGLPICRSIVAAHDGQIRAVGRPGGGSRFVVPLPLTRIERVSRAACSTDGPRPEGAVRSHRRWVKAGCWPGWYVAYFGGPAGCR